MTKVLYFSIKKSQPRFGFYLSKKLPNYKIPKMQEHTYYATFNLSIYTKYLYRYSRIIMVCKRRLLDRHFGGSPYTAHVAHIPLPPHFLFLFLCLIQVRLGQCQIFPAGLKGGLVTVRPRRDYNQKKNEKQKIREGGICAPRPKQGDCPDISLDSRFLR